MLKHKRVEEAALLIRPHLSDSASITLTQRLNAMTVTDRPEKLDQIGKVLAAFDAPPRGFTFAVKLVRARADVPEGSIAREIGGLGAKLKSMFQFNDYALIDSVVLRAAEGGRVDYQFGEEYTLSFTVRTARRRQRAPALALRLSKVYKSGERSAVFLRPLYRSSMPVTLSQTLVVGASKEEKLEERSDPDPPRPGAAARRRRDGRRPGAEDRGEAEP